MLFFTIKHCQNFTLTKGHGAGVTVGECMRMEMSCCLFVCVCVCVCCVVVCFVIVVVVVVRFRRGGGFK